MSKRRTRPTFITEELKLATCQTCKVIDSCGNYNFVLTNAIIIDKRKDSGSKNESKVKREYGCTWHSDYAEDEVKSY